MISYTVFEFYFEEPDTLIQYPLLAALYLWTYVTEPTQTWTLKDLQKPYKHVFHFFHPDINKLQICTLLCLRESRHCEHCAARASGRVQSSVCLKKELGLLGNSIGFSLGRPVHLFTPWDVFTLSSKEAQIWIVFVSVWRTTGIWSFNRFIGKSY